LNKNSDNEIVRSHSGNKFENIIQHNQNDNRKFFIRNSVTPPNFQNIINNKASNKVNKLIEKENEDFDDKAIRKSFEDKNQLIIENFRNMLKEASSSM